MSSIESSERMIIFSKDTAAALLLPLSPLLMIFRTFHVTQVRCVFHDNIEYEFREKHTTILDFDQLPLDDEFIQVVAFSFMLLCPGPEFLHG